MAWAKTGNIRGPAASSGLASPDTLTAAGPALSSALTEQVVATFTIIGGKLVAADVLHDHVGGSFTQAVVAGNATARIRVGAVGSGITGAIAAQALSPLNNSAAGARQFVIDAYLTVRAIGASGSIIGDIVLSGPAFNATAAAVLAPVTTAAVIDTTQNRDIVLTIQQSAANFTAGAAQVGFIRRVA